MAGQTQSADQTDLRAKGIAPDVSESRRLPELQAVDLIDYRLYFQDDKGHIRSVAVLTCPDDDQAISIAKALLLGAPGELWERGRRIVGFETDRSQIAP